MTGWRAWRTGRIAGAARIVIGIEFAVAVAVIVYAGIHDFSDVFNGSPPPLPAQVEARCEAIDPATPCHVSITELNAGRYRVATDAVSRGMTVVLDPRPHAQGAPQLLVRVSQPKKLRIEGPLGSDRGAAAPMVTAAAGRVVVPIAGSAPIALSFAPIDGATPAPIVLDEIGLFPDGQGLLTDVRPLFGKIPPYRYHGTLVPRTVARLCLFSMLAALFLPPRLLQRINPLALVVVCFSICLVDLAVLYSPYWDHDLRAVYAGGAAREPAGTNLNGGLWQGFRFLEGKGLTVADGVVPWQRMPGYGLFCGIAGALFGHRSILEIAMSTILLQIIFYCAALGVFAWAAGLVFPPSAVWVAGLWIAWLPKQLGLTQGDAIIAAAALLVLAALCLRLWVSRDGRPVPLGVDIAVHSAFAVWLMLRPDVLPGWLVVSLYLHRRNWQRLLIPAAFFLVIGGTWGVYKARYTREFTMTTSSVGASLFCGLFEVPSRFRFAMACNDATYFDWIHEHTPYRGEEAAANSLVTREVLKFWAMYPGHFATMVDHKMMRTIDGDVWPGYPTQLHVFVFESVPRYWLVLSLLTIIVLSVVVGHQRERTLLLAWPLFLNAPIFWVMFASLGRFYSAAGVALVAAAVPPLFEQPFYASIVARRWRALSVLACAGVFALTAWPFHDWLLRNEAFHYWTPFLDPSRSPLNVFK